MATKYHLSLISVRHLVYLQRADGTQLGSIDVAVAKAKSALLFKRPSKNWEALLAPNANVARSAEPIRRSKEEWRQALSAVHLHATYSQKRSVISTAISHVRL